MYKSDFDGMKDKYYYPFLQYRNEGSQEVCGRVYCEACLENSQRKEPFVCPYCLGLCMCDRCNLSDSIAKYQSQFIKAGGTFSELK